MKKVFRHYSTWLLLVGVTVSLFAFLNGADVYQRVQYALAEINQYQYKNSYNIYISEIENMEEVIQELNLLDGNVVITDQHIYLNATGYYRLVNLVVKQDEDYPYPVDYITNKTGLILGTDLKEYCYKNGNSDLVIKINGTEQIVAGFIGSGYSDYLDGQILMGLDNRNVNELLGTQDMVSVEYGSNKADADAGFNAVYDVMREKYNITYEKNTGKYIEVGDDAAGEQFYMVIALFAMINCVVISEFWILRRKDEMLVRKLWGFTNVRLFGLMYREMFMVSGVATGINLLVRLIFHIVNKNESGEMFIQKLLTAVIFMIISSFIMVLVPVHHASKYRLSDGLES